MKELLIEHPHPHIVRLTLHRPERKNALSLALIQELTAFLKQTPSDIRVIIIKGAQGNFCSGLDLNESLQAAFPLLKDLYLQLLHTPQVTIAQVEGMALAGGFGIIAACDLIYATPTSRYLLPEARRGFLPAFVKMLSQKQLPIRLIKELTFTCEFMSAERLYNVGFINQLYDEVEPQTLEQAKLILKSAPQALRLTKQMLQSFDEDFEEAMQYQAKAFKTGEVEEGIAAFKEKRPPQWE